VVELVREPEMVPELEPVLELELERVLEQVWVPERVPEQELAWVLERVLVEHSRLGPRQ